VAGRRRVLDTVGTRLQAFGRQTDASVRRRPTSVRSVSAASPLQETQCVSVLRGTDHSEDQGIDGRVILK